MKKINNIAEYIQEISKLIQNNEAYVYRGENKIFPTSCVPNIFRENRRLSNFSFEKNILNKIRSEGLDTNQSYLLTAIEAQHGGFPSRLLDISYNSLIALHFAVTPFYNSQEQADDDKDGQVIIIKIEDMLSPSSTELGELYANELLNNQSIKNRMLLLAHQHKMVDFYSKNQRIKAQQGGFIIFYGNEFRPLPEYMLQRIIIPSTAKSLIRDELDLLFGISNAYVYPESNNLVARIIKSTDRYANFDTFNNRAEIDKVLRKFKYNLQHYIGEALKLREQILEHVNSLKEMLEDKDASTLKKYCEKFHIDYHHIPRKKKNDELQIYIKDLPSYIEMFQKILNQKLVDQVIRFECYINDFYLDFTQSKEFIANTEIKDEQLTETYFKELEKVFEQTARQACNDLTIILRHTTVKLTPYEQLIG
ncbi:MULTISPECIES: FRG domain-containing protein [Bacillus]|uniref:FRG domain-containing protein n=1 Tax=Bacillus TaxID=1386 RepID=UPI0022E6FF40|nr:MULTISPECIES: FRG domain-containing protein [Bacillus]MDA1881004.1 FRG domain-containing protein [Bacillus cereus group sp. BY10-2LC]MDV5068334.1 FRG domain-containing protein [Bacillus sp. W1]